MAFMDYKPALGFEKSPWVGFEVFQRVFKDADFIRALKNSLTFNLMDLFIGFPIPIILAIMLNELKFPRFKKISQTILYLPHFLSWVIVASVALSLFKPETGLVNILLVNSGLIDKGIPFLTEKWHWAVSYVLMGVWQTMGWGTIIYLAAITSINEELYEAATVDGAGRFGKIWNVTLPGLRTTMVTMLILNLGRIMGSNFERLYAFDNVQVRDFQYQLAIYVFDKGLASGIFNRATAVGLFQSLVGLLLILITDRIAKRLGEDGLI
jgi:putative aldouronate transport system permease protein